MSSAIQGDFTAGELSPALTARVDLSKYGKGCQLLQNFLVQAHGGAVKRPGFELLGELGEDWTDAVLVPFVFNQEQAYCLVFGERKLLVAVHDGFVIDDDGQRYEAESPYTLEQAKNLSWVQSADVLFLACAGIAPQQLKRYGHADWRFEAMTFTSPLPSPANATAVNAGSSGTLNTPYTYYVTAVNADGKESGKSNAANVTGCASNNWPATRSITVSWSAVADARSYRIYKTSYNGRAGYVAEVTNTSWSDLNYTPSTSEGAPDYDDPFPEEDYPGCVALFEQRLVFASSPNRPQTIWMSKSGDYTNFATYKPAAADCPIELTIASQEVSPANWLVSLRSLIMGLDGSEWEITCRADNSAFSASNAKVSPQSYWGSSLRKVIIIGNVILHVSSSGRQVRSLQYEFAADSYNGMDLSIMTQHLLEGYRITDWTYQKSPDSIVWVVRNDGVLLGLTFQAEHQISAWHRHVTDGQFLRVCSVPHGQDYSLFALVKRGDRLLLERQADRYLPGHDETMIFADCAQVYSGRQPVREISGIRFLDGKTVSILADGAVVAPRVVENGRVTLDQPASHVVIGLPYVAELRSMPVEIAGQEGASVGMKKQINAVGILFKDSLGVKVGIAGPTGEGGQVKWQQVNWRTNEPYGVPPAPFSGIKTVVVPTLADNQQSVCVCSDLPTPVTVLALIAKVKINGG